MEKHKYPLKSFWIPTLLVGALVLGVLVIVPFKENARESNENISYEVCFTPHQKCLPLIQRKLVTAKETIRLQSYSFTSKPIADSLIEAHQRGVKVIVIADKSQARDKRSQIKRLHEQGIDVFIDYKPAISHNKILILGEDGLFTGSYNWTGGAEQRNSENLVYISNKELAQQYITNFNRRMAESIPLQAYLNLPQKGKRSKGG